MNKRQAKKNRKILNIRANYGFIPLKTIKKLNRLYENFINSPAEKKRDEFEKKILRF